MESKSPPKADNTSKPPKFASPPIFQNWGTKNENQKVSLPSSKSDLQAGELCLNIKEKDVESPKPQNVIHLTPIKDHEGFPLTPISNESFAISKGSNQRLFPLTSTQRDVLGPKSDPQIVGFRNERKSEGGPSALTSTPARDAKSSPKHRFYPIFKKNLPLSIRISESKQECLESSCLESPSDTMLSESPSKILNEESYTSDDLFEDYKQEDSHNDKQEEETKGKNKFL